MLFKLGEIRNMKDPMIALLEKDLPIKEAWKLTKLVKAFDKELAEIEEFRVDLVKKLGEDGDGGNTSVPEDKMEEFVNKFNELLQTDVDIEFDAIDIENLGDIQTTAKELMVLGKIFK